MKFSTKIILILSGLLFAFATLEIITRLSLPPPPTFVIQNLHEKEPEHGSALQIFGKTDNDLYYPTVTGRRIKSNVKALVRSHFLSKQDIEITTNSYGFRYKELDEKTQTDFRILVLGDSITIGDYLPEHETYTYYIEKYLLSNPPASLKDKNIQVINAGVGAIGIENELAILVERGLTQNPDIVILELYLNDAHESGAIRLIKPPQFVSASSLVNFITYRINLMRANKYQFQFTATRPKQEIADFKKIHPQKDEFNKLIIDNFDDWGYAFSPNFTTKISQVLPVFQEIADENNFDFVVVFFPVRYQIESSADRNEPQTSVASITKELGIKYLDLLPFLREKYQNDKVNLYFDHAHPTAAGNEFIAGVIAEFLKN